MFAFMGVVGAVATIATVVRNGQLGKTYTNDVVHEPNASDESAKT